MIEPLLPIRTIDAGEAGTILVVTLEQGDRPVVVLDESLMARLDRTLAALPPNPDGFILESAAPRAFVAGADLKAIMAMDDPTLHQYLEYGASIFQRISDLPCPSAAIIHGACLGGGLELAMHCDGLIGLVDPDAKPFPIGLPEAGLKICPGWGGTNLLPARIDARTAIIATATGKPFNAHSAAELGLFDATVTSHEGLIPRAIQWIGEQRGHTDRGTPMHWIGADQHFAASEAGLDKARAELAPTPEGDAVLDAVAVGLREGWRAAIQKERNELVRLRHTEPAREAIESFFARSSKK
ncbi:MAG: enoyl-CoA hydratase/isomerase family protein [Phycisphaerales bacterium]|nr:enoyl-CoA hydratase/isomerase family protein [Planctomycetota bacterium]MCH8507685.1 enoyl-CoA hydratase/isomerase family protein [Phycisphaerales bacterium]